MPVLKIKKGDIWEELGGTSPADGGNADTLDGKHASEFASATDVSNLKALVGDVSVSEQIEDAIATKADSTHTHEEYASVDDMGSLQSDVSDLQTKVGNESVSDQIGNALANFSSGKTLTEHLTEEMMILTSLHYGDTLPEPGVAGRIFFRKVTE